MTIQKKRQRVENVIARIRFSHKDQVYLYTAGCCYEFYLILREIFGPQVTAYYSNLEGHVYSKIYDRYWDIRGSCDNPPRDIRKMSKRLHKDAPGWSKRDFRTLGMAR